ncbi:hypothetical protein Achl_4043 (plasmid) [Pseudarthrobacter chlorophenolicus A6]|uniref:Uncharacterized protein n=1 Tax=Pseudarthrobacter chlorophenolicus (strain ATCC 700700 / DSM 12829 / CIP 107037 / JCM 12360 / KCTC 9906 / NCIMB 13794 / A6) TaxID=452863 RepID=B8HHU7_PSECP|nr:hypothetical protein [Pseudarthrobacter chlorophenolicus]ACL41994.1 hypothetical protein Achl_4043 [Pseudarthrobacter chlorophenolicus A6]SDQ20026.1 hypothetical protein SAMN04489738_0694 [Pseudarthrobacter chlorophenolicus]
MPGNRHDQPNGAGGTAPTPKIILRINGAPDVLFSEVDEIGYSYTPWLYEYDVIEALTPMFIERPSASMVGEVLPHRRQKSEFEPVRVHESDLVIDLTRIAEKVNTSSLIGTPRDPDALPRRVVATFSSKVGAYVTSMPEAWAKEFFSRLSVEMRVAVDQYGLSLNESLREGIAFSGPHPLFPFIEQDFR